MRVALMIDYVDTAVVYRNEQEIGDALRNLGVPRDQIFITSKLCEYQAGMVLILLYLPCLHF